MDTLYILDPIDVRVVMWNDQIKGENPNYLQMKNYEMKNIRKSYDCP